MKPKIKFDPRSNLSWTNFWSKTIKFDDDKDNPKPHGWHWFWALYCLRDSIPNFDFKKIKDMLPDDHWLNIEEKDKKAAFKKAKNGEFHYIPPLERPSHEKIQSWVGELDVIGKITEIDLSDIGFGSPKDIPISFSNFIFPVKVLFTKSRFDQDVLFNKSVFLETANFNNMVFFKGACFDGVRFSKDVVFENTKFSEVAGFTGAIFSGTAGFKNAVFCGETARFAEAIFEKTSDFTEARFKKYANFKGTEFKGRTIFQQAIFELHAPRFYGADFNNEIILNRIELPESKKFIRGANYKIYQKTIEENKSAYETLIHLMGEQHKYHDQHRFFREEMRWRQLGNKLTAERCKKELRRKTGCCHTIRQKNKKRLARKRRKSYLSEERNKNRPIGKLIENILIIVIFGFYRIVSDYGYGIGRAFGWWLGHIVVGGAVLFVIRCFYCFKDFSHDLGCSFGISLSNSHAFFFKGARLEECYDSFGNLPLFNVIWATQTIIGTLLITLLIITLRIRFRLK